MCLSRLELNHQPNYSINRTVRGITYQASDSKQITGCGSLPGYNFLAVSTRLLTCPEYIGLAVPLVVRGNEEVNETITTT